MNKQLIWEGSLVGSPELTGLGYRGDRPKAGCLICGRIFQSDLDRTAVTKEEQASANQLRQLWREVHAKSHTEAEHRELAHYKAQGNWCTPLAATNLAPYGLFSLTDLVLSDEHIHALRVARRAPENDADGPLTRAS